jgi:hypothetical protein
MIGTEHEIVGVWNLLSMTLTSDIGVVIEPFGALPSGRIIYMPGGYMMTTLARRDRPDWLIADPLGGSPQEKIAAVDSYSTYSGRYSVNDDQVTHHIDLSIFPNWVGQDEERVFKISDNILTLKTPPFEIMGSLHRGEAIWRRVDG